MKFLPNAGQSKLPLVSSAVLLLTLSESALAYVGPGLGAGTIGVILGLVGSVLLAIFAFFWYPIKRALFGNKTSEEEETYDAQTEEPAELQSESDTK